MKTSLKPCLITSALLVFPFGVQAQAYSIDWHTIAGGGGTSMGGSYSLSATIGQHDAGTSMGGGSYSLAGGFWSLYAVATPSAPMLSILASGTNTVLIAWPATSTGWTLQQNTNLVLGTWINLSNTVSTLGGQNQVILSPPIGNRFYRLQSP